MLAANIVLSAQNASSNKTRAAVRPTSWCIRMLLLRLSEAVAGKAQSYPCNIAGHNVSAHMDEALGRRLIGFDERAGEMIAAHAHKAHAFTSAGLASGLESLSLLLDALEAALAFSAFSASLSLFFLCSRSTISCNADLW